MNIAAHIGDTLVALPRNAKIAGAKAFSAYCFGDRYFSKVNSLSGGVIKTAGSIFPVVKEHLGQALPYLTIIKGVDLPFKAYSAVKSVRSVVTNYSLKDRIGLGIASLGAALSIGDLVDSALTLTRALCTFAKDSVLTIIGFVGLGFGFALNALGIVQKSAKIADFCLTRHKITVISEEIATQEDTKARKVFSDLIGVTDTEREKIRNKYTDEVKKSEATKKLLEKKFNALRRATSMHAARKIQDLYLNNISIKSEECKTAIRQANALNTRRIRVQVAGIVLNVVKIAALAFLLIPPIAPVVPAAILATATAAKIAMMIYEDFFLESHPEIVIGSNFMPHRLPVR